jgi:hypothetical protein
MTDKSRAAVHSFLFSIEMPTCRHYALIIFKFMWFRRNQAY